MRPIVRASPSLGNSTEPMSTRSAILATGDEPLPKVTTVIEAAMLTAPEVVGQLIALNDEPCNSEPGFGGHINYWVGAVVLVLFGAAAVLLLRFIVRIW